MTKVWEIIIKIEDLPDFDFGHVQHLKYPTVSTYLDVGLNPTMGHYKISTHPPNYTQHLPLLLLISLLPQSALHLHSLIS